MTGYKMKKRVGAIEEFAFEPLTSRGSRLMANNNVKQLHITLAVTGWISDKNPGMLTVFFLSIYTCPFEDTTSFRLVLRSTCLKLSRRYQFNKGLTVLYMLQIFVHPGEPWLNQKNSTAYDGNQNIFTSWERPLIICYRQD